MIEEKYVRSDWGRSPDIQGGGGGVQGTEMNKKNLINIWSNINGH